jgi:DNA-directed RNA polymerase subunit RPC12/RpoP
MPDEATTPVLRCADPTCGAEFVPHKHGQKYHSPRCRKRHWLARQREGPGLSLRCPQCGAKLGLGLRPSD